MREWGYVTCSRARTGTHLYLAEHDTLEHETPLWEPDPSGPPERAARSLGRSAAEPLALDQTSLHRDKAMRFLTKQ